MTAARPFGLTNCPILSTNKDSISEPSFVIEFIISKELFFNAKWRLKPDTEYGGFATNISNADIIKLQGDFVLCKKGNPVETITETVADKNSPMLVTNTNPNTVSIKFRKSIYTRKELEDYTIRIYLYKDEKYKTLVFENTIPKKNFNLLNKRLLGN